LAQSLIKTGQTAEGQKELQISSDLKAEAFKLEQQTQTGTPGAPANLSDSVKELDLGIGVQNRSEGNHLNEKSKQQLQESEEYYKNVIGTAHNNVGLLHAERQNFPAAVDQFRLAVKMHPQQPGLQYNLGLAYYRSQSFKQAAAPLENELKVNPDNRSAAMLLGVTLFKLGDYARAAELLSPLLEGQAADLNIYYALSSSLIRQRKIEAAERVIERMKTIAGDAPQIRLLLAEEFDSNGENFRALAELSAVTSSSSNALQVHYNAGLLYLKLGKRDAAVGEFERELVLNPRDIQARIPLAEILLGGSNIERGLALMRQVIEARPDDAEARLSLGRALLKKRQIAEAIENLEFASRLEPKRSEIHYELGQAYIAGGRKAEGKTQIDLSKELRSRSQPIKNDR